MTAPATAETTEDAIAVLSGELISVQTNVDELIHYMDSAIAQADKFIAAVQVE